MKLVSALSVMSVLQYGEGRTQGPHFNAYEL